MFSQWGYWYNNKACSHGKRYCSLAHTVPWASRCFSGILTIGKVAVFILFVIPIHHNKSIFLMIPELIFLYLWSRSTHVWSHLKLKQTFVGTCRALQSLAWWPFMVTYSKQKRYGSVLILVKLHGKSSCQTFWHKKNITSSCYMSNSIVCLFMSKSFSLKVQFFKL